MLRIPKLFVWLPEQSPICVAMVSVGNLSNVHSLIYANFMFSISSCWSNISLDDLVEVLQWCTGLKSNVKLSPQVTILCCPDKLQMKLRGEGGIKALLGMVRCRHPDVLAQVARGIANFAKCESRASTQGKNFQNGASSCFISSNKYK